MTRHNIYKIISYLISFVWLANGLLCKVLNLVPRHRLIVGRILGDENSKFLTILIGFLEMGLGLLIIAGYKPRLTTVGQIILVATMNILEFVLAPDLLLWGKVNLFFAILFIFVLYVNAFYINKNTTSQSQV